MTIRNPRVLVRMGSHAEKEYIEKTMRFLDGLVIGANLAESTPGATASLLVKVGGKKLGKSFYLDPMTYAFGPYKEDGVLRTDLDWIKSDQKRKGVAVRALKKSYAGLAREYGEPILSASKGSRSVELSELADDATAKAFCRRVAEYQLGRLSREFREDEEYAAYADQVPEPDVVFAPYFYLEPSRRGEWLDVNLRLAKLTAGLGLAVPVYAVLLADCECLDDNKCIEEVSERLSTCGIKGVWLWFSRFDEHAASSLRLRNFRTLVEKTSESGLEVFNMHGGYFSLALSFHGLSGISHGIGYGEQKDVMPVIGQSIPTVRYYLPALRRRLGVVEIQRSFTGLTISTPSDFHRRICDCVVCKGVVSRNVDEFSAFGDMHFATSESKKQAQTPAAAKRCRYHFLLNRIRERDQLGASSLAEIVSDMKEAFDLWGTFEWLGGRVQHLKVWSEVLR